MLIQNINNYFLLKGKQNSSNKLKPPGETKLKLFKHDDLMRKINSVIILISSLSFFFAVFVPGQIIGLILIFSFSVLFLSFTATVLARIYYYLINKFNNIKKQPVIDSIELKNNETYSTKQTSSNNYKIQIISIIEIFFCLSIFLVLIFPITGLLLLVLSSVSYCSVALIPTIKNLASKTITLSFLSTKATKLILIAVTLVLISGTYFKHSVSNNFELVKIEQVPNITENFFKYQKIHYIVDDNVLYYPISGKYEFLITPKSVELFGIDPIVLKGYPEDFNSLIMEILFDVKYANSLGLEAFGGGVADGTKNIVKGIMNIIRHPIAMCKQIYNAGEGLAKLARKITAGEITYDEIEKNVKRFVVHYWQTYKIKQAKEFGFQYSKIVFPEITNNILQSECFYRKSGEITTEIISAIAASYATAGKLRYLKITKNVNHTVKASKVVKYISKSSPFLRKVKKGSKASREFTNKIHTKKIIPKSTKLLSNKIFIKNGYQFETDSFGRIKKASGHLKLQKGNRNNSITREVGKLGKSSDDGGHIVGVRFGGPNSYENLVPMNSTLNRGRYKALEKKWARALENGQRVRFEISPIYKSKKGVRPDRFRIEYWIDGKQTIETMKNIPGG